ncbi:MarR family transcriptional regulator [Peribacillus sp. NJ4]|uniref:MarR family winged helix-turn-helix transcriptional regulator n=1 Tax=Peribacillus TaxID=2675229 RepID=UPI0025A13508|nr:MULTISPECIES: MarR family transcriptional regulator [unclassified Peribacillus]MDM5211223.1 MarR family transcriptional regulator [Peribacillus sp. NJ4]MDM5221534.1 MarR family transcriptional regulator [Peribacillus sp. NJ11]
MSSEQNLINTWLSFTRVHAELSNELDRMLQARHQTTLNEFYVLLFLSKTPEKKLRLLELQQLVGLSQSAMSRLSVRMENKSCGVIQRLGYEDDRRGVCAIITDRGEVRLQEILDTVNETLEKSLKNSDIDTALKLFVDAKSGLQENE